jgi:hypothetical protein
VEARIESASRWSVKGHLLRVLFHPAQPGASAQPLAAAAACDSPAEPGTPLCSSLAAQPQACCQDNGVSSCGSTCSCSSGLQAGQHNSSTGEPSGAPSAGFDALQPTWPTPVAQASACSSSCACEPLAPSLQLAGTEGRAGGGLGGSAAEAFGGEGKSPEVQPAGAQGDCGTLPATRNFTETLLVWGVIVGLLGILLSGALGLSWRAT